MFLTTYDFGVSPPFNVVRPPVILSRRGHRATTEIVRPCSHILAESIINPPYHLLG